MLMNTDILKQTAPAELNRMAACLWRGMVLASLKSNHTCCELDVSRTTFFDSNGLAALLAISQELSKRGGVVRVINPSRQVVQMLELTRVHRAVEIIHRESQDPVPAKPRPILVVEDEEHIRSVAEMGMRPLGRAVYAAENGQEAINIARRENPAVIILDYLMPVMDGVTTLRRLKADDSTKHIPLISMSANEKVARELADQFDGASLFLTKPFSPSALRNEVYRLINDNLSLAA